MEATRGSPAWWWRSRTSNPASCDLDDLEDVLLNLSDEEWTKLNGSKRDELGRLVTGNPGADEWEREAWRRVNVE